MTLPHENDIKMEVIFKSKSHEYSISNNSILIPIKLKRYGLSQVVNHLLSLGILFIIYIHLFYCLDLKMKPHLLLARQKEFLIGICVHY